MQTTKTRNGTGDIPQRTSAANSRSTRVSKTGGNESDSAGITSSKTPSDRSPKVTDRRSPRSPVTEKKRLSRTLELESDISRLQEDVKKAKDQLNLLEITKKQAQQEAEDAKQQLQLVSAKLGDSQRQLIEFSAAEEARLKELHKIGQERDQVWQAELEAFQKQQSADSAALSSAMSEIQMLKQQLEMAAESEAAHTKRSAEADSELQALKQDVVEKLAIIDNIRIQHRDIEKSEAEGRALVSESQRQIDLAAATIETLRSEALELQESISKKDIELEESNTNARSLEQIVKCLQEAGTDDLLKKLESAALQSEIEELRSALEAAEIKCLEEQTRCGLKLQIAHEMLESAKIEYGLRESQLELKLKNQKEELAELKQTMEMKTNPENQLQSELESKLTRSITDISELKASLMDKETELQNVMEENETLKSEIGKKEIESCKKYEVAVAELELAKAAEQDARMRLGYITEEAGKSSRRAARVAEQLDAAQAMKSEMEAELRRLRVQSDQWRKAAEAAAAALTNSSNVRVMDRTSSMDSECKSLGGKLMSSPLSDDFDLESPKKKSNSVLRRMSGLWKKSPK